MTEDGRLCAKEMMNIQFFGRLNREMPAFLRSRGWDIDDCHAYDEAKEQLKSEQEKYQERRERGRSSVVYKAQAEAEKNRLSEKVDELQAEVSRLEGDLRQAKLEVAEARRQAKSAVDEADRAEQRTAEAEQRLSELIEPIHSLEEYHLTADKAEDVVTAIEASENAIEGLQRLPRLVPFYNRQKASKDVLEVSNGLRKLFDIAKDLVKRLFGFEELSRMPEKKRRSPKLDERIKQASARVVDVRQKNNEDRDRD
jgi:outer membrane murein-binding lipoprotein Lpp